MDSIAGYRLVRVLARGRHSEVWLGATRATDARAAPVAIKLFHPRAPLARVDAEVEALGRASHRHLQRLIDVSVDPQQRACLVLERLGTSLAAILANRNALTAGEAVTVLAPVALAVSELHRVGVAHGRIDAGSILFDTAGAPVLSCFGDATLVGEFPHPPEPSSLTPAEAAAQPSLGADRRQLALLAQRVLERTEGAAEVLSWVQQHDDAVPGFAAELADRLFSTGPASPVELPRAVAGGRTHALELREAPRSEVSSADGVGESESGGHAAARGGALAGLRTAVQVPEWLDSILDGWLGRARAGELVARAREALALVRKPVWVAAALGAVALVVSAIVLGAGSPSGGQVQTESASPAATATSESVSSEPAGLHDQDPLVAARALLALRDSCIRELSVLCLDRVNQPDSAAMDADRHHIRHRQHGVAVTDGPDWTRAELVLIDELGDGALLDLVLDGDVDAGMDPVTASLLLVRTEIGWLIRDLVH